jgi:hypothetical protein
METDGEAGSVGARAGDRGRPRAARARKEWRADEEKQIKK